jgi:hypothetical protein
MFPVKGMTGKLTNGEAKTLTAMACETDPAAVEAYLVIAFKHNDRHEHELIVAGNITHSADATVGLLVLAMNTAMNLGNPNVHYGEIQESSKVFRLFGDIRHHRFPFHH